MSTERSVQGLGQPERLGQGLSKQVGRRAVLKRLGAAALGGALLLVGLPRTAEAYSINGCNLCRQPTTGGCAGCDCVWCWPVCNYGSYYNCCECYNPYVACSGGCYGVKCSSVEYQGPC